MTATLSLPRGLRHPSWYLPLLLPVLPLLGYALHDDTLFAGVRLGFAALLFVLGATVALALPALLGHLGPSATKEAEHVRGAWLAALFVVQVPLIIRGPDAGFDLTLFAASCALVASLPFGAEFQQRTLAGLLSQPVARAEWWHLKTRVLAAALALHWLVFLLSRLAANRAVTPELALGTFVAAAVAFGTTPWWTLLTRSLLPGLVFSLAVPFLTMGLVSATADALGIFDLVRSETSGPVIQAGVDTLILSGLAAYTCLGIRSGFSRWMRLEAPGEGTGESRMLGLPRLGAASTVDRTAASPLRWLIRKELGLQAVTIGVAFVALALGGIARLTSSNLVTHDIAVGAFLLAVGATMVLAGATPIAEERRLGTLDPQLLQPVSRSLQWWVKLALAGALTVVVAAAAFLVLASDEPANSGRRSSDLLQAGLVTLAIFAPAFLASSGASNALRAAIAAVAAAVLVVALVGTALNLTTDIRAAIANENYTAAQTDPQTWKNEAARLAPDELRALEVTAGRLDSLVTYLRLFPALPGLLALAFAWRNFKNPGPASRRLWIQFAACLVLLAALIAAWSALVIDQTRSRSRAQWLSAARVIVDMERRLSPVEQTLWQQHRREPLSPIVYLDVEPFERERAGRLRGFTLPLSPASRLLLIHRGKIPDDLREALRQDALRRGEDISQPPQPPPIPGQSQYRYVVREPQGVDADGNPLIRMTPGLMRRYGLIPAPADTNPTPRPAPSRR